MSLPIHFFEFMDVIQRATQQLSGPLKLESVEVRILDAPVGSQSSRGQFAQVVEGASESFSCGHIVDETLASMGRSS